MRKKKHVWCFFSGDILITVVLHPLMCKENIAAKKIKLRSVVKQIDCRVENKIGREPPMFLLERTHIIAKCYILHGHSITPNAIC